jgi:glutathione S-transferase
MSIQLYSWKRSSGSRVHWALEELGVPYQYISVDRARKENRAPEFLAINPNGKVPALIDSDQPFFESLAILLHLAETYGRKEGLWPDGGAPHADALCWSVWGMTELHPYMMQFIYQGLDTPVSYPAADRSKATAKYNHLQLLRLLDMLDKRLAQREHLLGEFSIADIPAASSLNFGTSLGLDLEGRANVASWLARCRARPALVRVVEAES